MGRGGHASCLMQHHQLLPLQLRKKRRDHAAAHLAETVEQVEGGGGTPRIAAHPRLHV